MQTAMLGAGRGAAIYSGVKKGRERSSICRPTRLTNADEARIAAYHEETKIRIKLKGVMQKYDTNHSKKLERDQLVQLMTDSDYSTPNGTKPTDEEVSFVIKVADRRGDGCIELDELEDAMCCWFTFIENRQKFEEVLKNFDASQTGYLSKSEVKAYLKDINGGKPVSDAEVDMVVKEADVLQDGKIGAMDLHRATACWYSYVDKKKKCCVIQ